MHQNRTTKHTWEKLASHYSKDARVIELLWKEIEGLYNSPERHYHNLSHIEFLLKLAIEYEHSILDFDTMLFSIYYHDIIYNVNRHDNEENSAELARQRMIDLNVPEEKLGRCEIMILATKDHLGAGDSDTDLFLDFDLAILGSDINTYEGYAQKIRQEYAEVPDHFYQNTRRKILEGMLSRERIFKTAFFYKKYELRARENLKKEIDGL